MRLIILVVMLTFGLAGEAAAGDAKVGAVVRGELSCSEYLDAYSKTELKGENKTIGYYEWGTASGWINGFITGYNVYSGSNKDDIVDGMSITDTYRWLASWCRDYPSKNLPDAVHALIRRVQ